MGKQENLLGQQFGKWSVIASAPNDKYNHARWLCQCDCGTIRVVAASSLKGEKSKSCGCQSSTRKTKSCIGNRFNKLIVIEEIPIERDSSGNKYWLCRCDCGNYTKVSTANLRSGRISSCGCLLKTSLGEQHIELCLSSAEIEYEKEYRFSDLNNLRFDFYLPKLNRLIEFDGKQHFEPNEYFGGEKSFLEQQKRDQIKNNYAKQHNIPLIRIPYQERDNITIDLILSDKYLVK